MCGIFNVVRSVQNLAQIRPTVLVNESVGFMAVPFSAFGSTVPSVAKLLKGMMMAKRQKQDDKVWDSLGRKEGRWKSVRSGHGMRLCRE